jgi:hypothetical protein
VSAPGATSVIVPITTSGEIQDITPNASGRHPSDTEERTRTGTQSVTAQVLAR